MTPALPMPTSVYVAAARGPVQGISAFAAGSVDGAAVRDRSVDGSSVAAADASALGVQRTVDIYNSKFAGGVRRSLLMRPPV